MYIFVYFVSLTSQKKQVFGNLNCMDIDKQAVQEGGLEPKAFVFITEISP